VADFDPVAMLRVLTDHEVRFVVVGGVAARLRGAPLLTQDVDITPSMEHNNLERLVGALQELDARLRTATEPDGVRFPFDAALIASATVWTMVTKHGDLDLVVTPAGLDGYEGVARGSTNLRVAEDPDLYVAVAALEDNLRSKEAAGRDKDLGALPMLRRTLEESG